MKPEVRIVSDGSAVGTQIFINGQPIESVTAVEWSVKVGEFAAACITFENVEVDVVGEQEESTP